MTLVLLAALLAGLAALRLALGPEGLEWPRDGEDWAIRGVRAGAAAIVGASLGIAGVMLQSLLRNPLASPDLIGPGAGAALAVTIVTYVHGLAASTEALPGVALGPAALVG